jgi:murein DD-endopeptidase MepM/ murein hydrolase activator NlpD
MLVTGIVTAALMSAVPVSSGTSARAGDSTYVGKSPDDISAKRLIIPVQGIKPNDLHPMFYDARGKRGHEAIDIMAPRGRPVVAVEDGTIAKLFTSVPGGLTVYHRSGEKRLLLRPSTAMPELPKRPPSATNHGYVGSTGNADEAHPHLHFAIFRLGPEKQWWKGDALDPYAALTP